MERYAPDKLERATRDVVCRSGYMEIMAGRGTPSGGVLIDATHIQDVGQALRRHGRALPRVRLRPGERPRRSPPQRHYHMGGIRIDVDCHTNIEGLLRRRRRRRRRPRRQPPGRQRRRRLDRLRRRAGDTMAVVARLREHPEIDMADVERAMAVAAAPLDRPDGILPFDLTTRLKEVMWEHCGVVRSAEGLATAITEIDTLQEQLALVSVPGPAAFNPAWNEALDLGNQLAVAKVIVQSAVLRKETWGAHARADFPERDDSRWLRYLVAKQADDGSIDVTERPVEFSRSARPAPEEAEVEQP